LGVALMSIILMIRHKSNIQRLLSGEEKTIGR
jgi:glycerol-3-phosphate acyltransferase PlsY